jgi:hypothetical protein
MNPICLISEGTRLGEIDVPAFELRRGDALCLHVPSLIREATQYRLIQALTGELPVPEISPLCCILYAEPARHRRLGLFQLFRPMRITDWLQYKAGISFREAEQLREEGRLILKDSDFEQDWEVCRLAGDPKAVLGLQAAWALGAEAVIFSLIGLGPWARDKIHEAVCARLDRCPAIELNHEYMTQGRRERDCLAGARCIELTRHSAGPASRQSA